MKAKILLTGLVAPMVFAACTQEEAFVPQQEAGKIDLSNRPTLGKVALGFGNQTRATLNDEGYFNSLKWTDTDAVGARLIDAPNDDFSKKFVNPIWKYTVGDVSYTNYKYEKGAGSEWTTDALMVEGNYMFYAPYDGNALYRDPLKMKFPVAQSINTEAELMEGANTSAIKAFFEDNTTTTVVGYKFLSSVGQEKIVSPTMTHIYAYPQITLVNKSYKDVDGIDGYNKAKDEYTPMTVKKVLISSSKIKENLVINQSGLRTALQDYVAEVKNQQGYVNSPKQEAGNWTDDAKFLKNARTSQIANHGVASTKDGSIVITFEPEITIAEEGEFKFHAILPAEAYAAGDLKFTIVMPGEEREQTFVVGGNAQTFGNPRALTYSPGKRYAKEEYNFGSSYGTKGYQVKPTAGSEFTITVNGCETGDFIPAVTDIDVLAGTEEGVNSLEKYLQNLTNNNRPIVESNTTFSFATYDEGDNKDYAKVVFNKAMIDMLNKYLNGSEATITFNSPMLISDELKGDYAIDTKYIFNAGVKQIDNKEIQFKTTTGKATFKGKVTLDGTISGKAIFNGEAFVNGTISGDAEFSTNATVSGTISGKAYFNGGTSTVTGTANGAEIKSATVTVKNQDAKSGNLKDVTVYGAGTLNIEKDYDGKITLGYKPDNADWTEGYLNVNADQTTAADGQGKLTVDLERGTLTNNKTIDGIALTWGNHGTLKNNGEIKADITVKAGASYEHGASAKINPLIVNAAELNGDGSVKYNAASVKNYGELTATNNGFIEVANELSYTTVTGAGTVNNTKLGVVYNKGTNTVYYETGVMANDDEFKKIAAVSQNDINKIVVGELWTVNQATTVPATFTVVEFKNNLSVSDVTLTFASTTEVTLAANSEWKGRTIEKSIVDGMKAIKENGHALTTKYLTLGGAYYANALANGGTLKLTSDIPLSSVKELTEDLTIDLNNKNISTSIEKALTVKDGVTLTIKNGTMTSSSEGANAGKIIRVEGDDATVILDNVTINSDNAVHVFSGENVNVTIKNCIITAKNNAAVVTNGNSSNEANVTIEGSTIKCLDATNEGVAVYAPAAGNLTIKNSTLTGSASAVCYRGHGTLKIEGGTFESTKTGAFTVAPNDNGTTAAGAAIVVSPYAPNDAVVNISNVILKSASDDKVGFWEGSIMPGSKNRNTIQKLTWDKTNSTSGIKLFKGATSAAMSGTAIANWIQ